MWALLDDHYINSVAIVRLQDDGRDGSIVHLADGSKLRSTLTIDELTLMSGAIIAATPGFEAAWVDSSGKVDREVIAGWRATEWRDIGEADLSESGADVCRHNCRRTALV